MIRWIEKKNWRNNIDSCWDVSNNITSCLNKSSTFSTLDATLQSNILKSVNKNYISKYIKNWVANPNSASLLSGVEGEFYNQESNLWSTNKESLEALNSECNILSLQECCQEKYNLKNLEGDYEWAAQKLKKN
jgi:hypothetical protein